MALCPHCLEDIQDEIHQTWFMFRDCAEEFDTKCPVCEEDVEVRVEQAPIFYVNKRYTGDQGGEDG